MKFSITFSPFTWFGVKRERKEIHLGQSSSIKIPDEERNKGHFLNEISGNRVLENQLKHLWNSFENVHSEDHITTVENCKTYFYVDHFSYSTKTDFFQNQFDKTRLGHQTVIVSIEKGNEMEGKR